MTNDQTDILKARIKTVFGAFKTPKEQKGQL